MKKYGILNSEISKVLADLGHTDEIIIADCGLPVPDGVKKIDLALKQGEPLFLDVVAVILSDMKVEKAILAEEIKSQNEPVHKAVLNYFNREEAGVTYLTHENFKKRSKQAKAIIRTGEVTPYANVILQSGVLF